MPAWGKKPHYPAGIYHRIFEGDPKWEPIAIEIGRARPSHPVSLSVDDLVRLYEFVIRREQRRGYM